MGLFNKSEKTISISTFTIVKLILVAAAAFIFWQVLGSISHQLTLIFISLLLAIGLNPAVSWITNKIKSKSRLRATGFAYIVVVSLLVGFLAIVIPPLVKQTSQFISEIPSTLNSLRSDDNAMGRAIRKYNIDDGIQNSIDNYKERFGENITDPVLNTAGRIGGTVVSIITVLILTFMMLVEGPMWFSKYLSVQPVEVRKKRKEMAFKMYNIVTGFFYGQVLIAFIAATFAAIMLVILNSIFNVSINPIAMSGIVFIFGLIPLVGNIIASVIVVLVCLISSLPMALIMLGFFIIYQQIENATLQPYIQSKKNQLTPLTVFIAALIGAGIAGILGALVAIPIAGCARVLLEDFITQHFPDYSDFNKLNKKG
jgi:predicted PurR-regulated permease PerM